MVHLSVLLEQPVTYTESDDSFDFDKEDADGMEDSDEEDVGEGDAEYEALEQD